MPQPEQRADKRYPSVDESAVRIDRAINALADQAHRMMLTLYRDHWWAEVLNDVDAIMATLPKDRVDYLFDGADIFFPEAFGFDAVESARSLYAGAAASGLPMAGPFEQERFAFADWGMSFEGILSGVVMGSALRHIPKPPPPDEMLFVTWRTASTHPFDLEARRMLGEHVYSGSIIHLEPADEGTLRAVYGEEVLASAAARASTGGAISIGTD